MRNFLICGLLLLTGCNEVYFFKKGAAVDATVQKESETDGTNSKCFVHIYIHNWGHGYSTSDLSLRAKLLTKECE